MRRLVLGVIALALTLAACSTGNSKLNSQREQGLKQRADTYARAVAAAPAPTTTNFPLRKALVKMTERQDLEHHPWYIYILGQNGNIIGYYVGQTVPVNACDFLSSTQDVIDPNGDGSVITTAPSMDGIFYGGSGSTAGCDVWFFFDAATDALIQIRGVDFFSSDQPLKVEAQPILVAK